MPLVLATPFFIGTMSVVINPCGRGPFVLSTVSCIVNCVPALTVDGVITSDQCKSETCLWIPSLCRVWTAVPVVLLKEVFTLAALVVPPCTGDGFEATKLCRGEASLCLIFLCKLLFDVFVDWLDEEVALLVLVVPVFTGDDFVTSDSCRDERCLWPAFVCSAPSVVLAVVLGLAALVVPHPVTPKVTNPMAASALINVYFLKSFNPYLHGYTYLLDQYFN